MWKITGLLTLLLVSVSMHSDERTSRPNAVGCEEVFPAVCEPSPLDISFIVDASSSIGKVNFVRCLNFIEDFMSYFDIPTVRMSMITFTGVADVNNAFSFDDHLTLVELKHAIANTNYTNYGSTNISAGLKYMRVNQDPQSRPGVRRRAIVITAGRSKDTHLTKLQAKAVRENDVEVIAIGVGSGVFYPELLAITGNGRYVFQTESYEVMHTITERLLFHTCDVPTSPECEMDPMELAFVIDSSNSVSDEAFEHCMDFVVGLVKLFKVDQQHVRIAAITFDHAANANDSFAFTDHESKASVIESLESIEQNAGDYTGTSDGIDYMRKVLMRDARPNTAKVSIVITDGLSQEATKTKAAADAATAEGILMFAVGVGSGLPMKEELLRIAESESRIVMAAEYSELNTIKDQLVNVTCTGILESFRSKWRSSYYPGQQR